MTPIFDTAHLHADALAALAAADVPTDKRHALLVGATVTGGAQLVYAHRLGGDWTIDLMTGIDRSAHVDGGIAIRGTW